MKATQLISLLDKLPRYATLECHCGVWWVRLGFTRYVKLDDMLHNQMARN